MCGLGAVMAKGLISPNPTDKAEAALAFTLNGVQTITKLALNPDADPAKAMSELAFPSCMGRELMKQTLRNV